MLVQRKGRSAHQWTVTGCSLSEKLIMSFLCSFNNRKPLSSAGEVYSFHATHQWVVWTAQDGRLLIDIIWPPQGLQNHRITKQLRSICTWNSAPNKAHRELHSLIKATVKEQVSLKHVCLFFYMSTSNNKVKLKPNLCTSVLILSDCGHELGTYVQQTLHVRIRAPSFIYLLLLHHQLYLCYLLSCLFFIRWQDITNNEYIKMTIQFSWPIHHVFFSFREKPCVNLGMLRKTKHG